MSRVLPHEERAFLASVPRWWPGLVNWSVQFANHGPRWMHVKLRCLPLHFACWVGSIYARRLP